MIKTIKKLLKSKEYYFTYSDQKKMIVDDGGNYYNSAYDIAQRNYTESDIDIVVDEGDKLTNA